MDFNSLYKGAIYIGQFCHHYVLQKSCLSLKALELQGNLPHVSVFEIE